VVPIVVEDPVTPFVAEDTERVTPLGVTCEWPYRESVHLVKLLVPENVCDGTAVKALRGKGHPNLRRRRDLR